MLPDDYDEIDRERERHEKLFGTAEEREAEARELAERQAQTRRDETLAWARQRAERQRPPVVEKTYAQKKQDEAAATKYWQGYIRQQLDSANMAMTKAIAQAIVNEERRCDQADFDLRTIIIDVRDRFDEMEARMNELEARISKRRGAATPTCDATPRGFDLDRLRGEWRH